MHNLGQTRSALRPDHLLQTPDTFVRTPIADSPGAHAIVHITPAAGARFTQYTVELEPGAVFQQGSGQRFLYVLGGEAEIVTDLDTNWIHIFSETTKAVTHPAGPGTFAFFPERYPYQVKAVCAVRLAVIEKLYQPAPIEVEQITAIDQTRVDPAAFILHEDDVTATPLAGDPDLLVRALMPDTLAHDFAVNLMTYAPGATLPQVEIHVMEHGLLMLEGQGIYRLGDRWYPVQAGDFIWMAPFCPQWYGALGKLPTKYLIYKDWNRTP